MSGWNWTWTGFNGGYPKITTTWITPGATTATPGTTVASEQQPAKTLWDYLGLLAALAIPIVVGFGVAWFTRTQQLRDQQLADQRAKSEQEAIDKRVQIDRDAAEKRAQTGREIALDNQNEVALQAYIDKLSELLLEKNLRGSAEDDELRKIARVRTLTVLPRLDGKRKGSVLQFLHESGLLDVDKDILELHGADLSKADLSGADLRESNLSEANLRGAARKALVLTGRSSVVDSGKPERKGSRKAQSRVSPSWCAHERR